MPDALDPRLPPRPAGGQLSVAVLSPHQLVREGLARLLSAPPERFRVVDVSSSDGHLGGHDLTVYDLSALVHRRDGVGDLCHLVTTGVPVLGVVPAERPDVVPDALALGVAATVPSSVTAEELREVALRVAAGEVVSAEQRRAALRARVQARTGLSGREVQVLELISAGLGNQVIARDLYLSINSVKTYVRSAYRKIGVTTRPEAVLWVLRQGLAGADTGGAPDERP